MKYVLELVLVVMVTLLAPGHRCRNYTSSFSTYANQINLTTNLVAFQYRQHFLSLALLLPALIEKNFHIFLKEFLKSG